MTRFYSNIFYQHLDYVYKSFYYVSKFKSKPTLTIFANNLRMTRLFLNNKLNLGVLGCKSFELWRRQELAHARGTATPVAVLKSDFFALENKRSDTVADKGFSSRHNLNGHCLYLKRTVITLEKSILLISFQAKAEMLVSEEKFWRIAECVAG